MGIILDSLVVKDLLKLKKKNKYGRIFLHTNEMLEELFCDIDFKDKEVLSVLASSDQMFMAYNLGAKNVDTFDKNKLTRYYYYLRMWSAKYMKMLYPYFLIENDYEILDSLLYMVKPSSFDENLALLFWKKLCKKRFLFSSMFITDIDDIPFDDVKDLECGINKRNTFYNVDFFKKININKKYDIIIFSNTLEWAEDDYKLIKNAKNNLSNLVKDDGIIICSELRYRMFDRIKMEREIFESDFDYENIKDRVGYVYRKI